MNPSFQTLASCFRMFSFLRWRGREININQLIPSEALCLLCLCTPGPLLSSVALRKTTEKSLIPHVAGLLKWQEISFQTCLNVKSPLQTKDILKLRLKFPGWAGFVALSYTEQGFATDFTWEWVWWERFPKHHCVGGFPQGISSMIIPAFIAARWLGGVVVVLLW